MFDSLEEKLSVRILKERVADNLRALSLPIIIHIELRLSIHVVDAEALISRELDCIERLQVCSPEGAVSNRHKLPSDVAVKWCTQFRRDGFGFPCTCQQCEEPLRVVASLLMYRWKSGRAQSCRRLCGIRGRQSRAWRSSLLLRRFRNGCLWKF